MQAGDIEGAGDAAGGKHDVVVPLVDDLAGDLADHADLRLRVDSDRAAGDDPGAVLPAAAQRYRDRLRGEHAGCDLRQQRQVELVGERRDQRDVRLSGRRACVRGGARIRLPRIRRPLQESWVVPRRRPFSGLRPPVSPQSAAWHPHLRGLLMSSPAECLAPDPPTAVSRVGRGSRDLHCVRPPEIPHAPCRHPAPEPGRTPCACCGWLPGGAAGTQFPSAAAA